MYRMDVHKYPSLNIFFKGKVQCPDFTLFLPGLYEHVHTANKYNTGKNQSQSEIVNAFYCSIQPLANFTFWDPWSTQQCNILTHIYHC